MAHAVMVTMLAKESSRARNFTPAAGPTTSTRAGTVSSVTNGRVKASALQSAPAAVSTGGTFFLTFLSLPSGEAFTRLRSNASSISVASVRTVS